MCRGKPSAWETCIIHDSEEGLAGKQCVVRGQTVESVCPVVADTVQPNPRVLDEVMGQA